MTNINMERRIAKEGNENGTIKTREIRKGGVRNICPKQRS